MAAAVVVALVGVIAVAVDDGHDHTGVARASVAQEDPTAVSALGGSSRYAPISPTRVLDTRTDTFRRRLPTSGALSIAPVTPAVASAAGVTPAAASAVVVNITMVDPAAAGFATVWPTGSPQPNVSSLNANLTGQNVANLVTVPLGADGFISVYTSTGADYVIDVQGVYVNATTATAGRFVPVAQQRALDTRGKGPLGPRASLSVDLKPFGVPSDASAAVLNVTATNALAAGYFTVWPAATAMPNASSLNATGLGHTVANQVMSRVTNGVVSIYAETGGDVIVDVSGYFTGAAGPESAAGLFVALAPARLLDTRSPGAFSTGQPLASNTTLTLPIAGRSGVPSAGVLAMALNVTATRTQASGYVTGWPANTPLPPTSSVNFVAPALTVANHTITALNGGAASYFSFGGNDLLVDLLGYWTNGDQPPPPPGTPAITIGTVSPPVTTAPPSGPPSLGPHAFLYTAPGGYGRWNPCAPIVYVVNADRADQAMVDQMNLAIGEIEKATGLDFVYAGPTSGGLDFNVPQGADAVLGFSDQFATPLLGGSVIGIGGGTFDPLTGRVTSGFAFADVSGVVSPDRLRATFMHEIAHMVGLDHVAQSDQLMYFSTTAVSTFRNGDLEGLWRVGAAQGCLAGDEAPADQATNTGAEPVLVVRS